MCRDYQDSLHWLRLLSWHGTLLTSASSSGNANDLGSLP
jgi:hypothetical protein